jgi:hypothetical protein
VIDQAVGEGDQILDLLAVFTAVVGFSEEFFRLGEQLHSICHVWPLLLFASVDVQATKKTDRTHGMGSPSVCQSALSTPSGAIAAGNLGTYPVLPLRAWVPITQPD